MKIVKITDLKERISVQSLVKHDDDEGGWEESWENQETLWAMVQGIPSRDGFRSGDLGGPMASGIGFMQSLMAARYRVVVRSKTQIKPQDRIVWHLGGEDVVLKITSSPFLVQNKDFLCFTAVEVLGDDDE